MKRSALLVLALCFASCGNGAELGTEPDSLAMRDSSSVSTAEGSENDLLVLVIDGERFELRAGICSTYENGTFRFALADGDVGEHSRVIATVERFDTGEGYDVHIAVEGDRDDGSTFSWYARSSLAVHDMSVSVFASALDGSARFDSIGGDNTPGTKAFGTFAIRCSGLALPPAP